MGPIIRTLTITMLIAAISVAAVAQAAPRRPLRPHARTAVRQHVVRHHIRAKVRAGAITREQARHRMRMWREQHRPPAPVRRAPAGERGQE